jgi:hypothetical protein
MAGFVTFSRLRLRIGGVYSHENTDIAARLRVRLKGGVPSTKRQMPRSAEYCEWPIFSAWAEKDGLSQEDS